MSKHTPGPWIAAGYWVEHPKDDVPDICTCSPTVIGQGERNEAEVMANVRLIAAAPDLLFALREAVASLKWAADVIGNIPPGSQYMGNLRMAQIVIEEATGEEA